MAYNLLKGKRGIIFGALDENSIAWKTAEKVYEEGGRFVLTNAPIAMRMGKINELAKNCEAEIIPADATSVKDLEHLIGNSVEILGGPLDFILHSIGMSPNVRKGKSYGDLNYEWMHKSLDVSAMSFHKVMQTAEKLDVMNDFGSIVALSYIAAQRTYPDYSDMAQAKAMLESIARSYGERFGKLKNVRVNTISQSPTVTTAGSGVGGFDVFLEFADMLSPLGNASAEDCANYIVVMFSDFTKKVTMQNLLHDGGFSTSGITEKLVDYLKKKSSHYHHMVVFPNAKINLGLNIINKRPDGYHEIQSCFLPIKWFDVLEAIEASTFSFTSSGIPIPGDAATNLCVKAYQLLKKDFNLPEIAIHLHKNIPIGAGLGGGSADCAFMLSLLNEKFDLKISRVRLESYAATLGSDIPFFINNKPTYVEGTGHTFTSINLNLSGLYLLAAYPKIHISTQEAYAQVNPKRPQSELKKVLETLPIEQWQNEVKNDFEQALLKKFSVIDEMKRHFLDIGSIYTSMTGSGSAVFGLFLEKPVVKIDFPHVLFKID